MFLAGSADRILVSAGISYAGQMWVFRALVLVAPLVIGRLTYRICCELRDSGRHPLRGVSGGRLRRTTAGGFEQVRDEVDEPAGQPREPASR